VRATQTAVWRLCRHLVGPAAADDVSQDAYLRAVSALPAFRADSSALTWLLAIARHAAADHVRREQRRRRLLALRPTAVAAHGGNVLATDYRPRITSARIPGVDIHVIEGGGRVELTNHTDRPVTVLGYDGEPYLRVGPDGVFRNRRSPAVAINSSLRSTKA